MALNAQQDQQYTEWLKALAKAVKECRAELKITQSQMAEKCGFDMKYYQDIEYARRPITTRTMFQLTCGLGLSVAELTKKADQHMAICF